MRPKLYIQVAIFIALLVVGSVSNLFAQEDEDITDSGSFNVFNIHSVTQTFYDPDGFDINGFDEKGTYRNTNEKYDSDGFDVNGFSINGIHKLTQSIYSPLGFNALGIHVITNLPYNLRGFDIQNIHSLTQTYYDPQRFTSNGLHRDTGTKYDLARFNVRGFDEEGYHRETGTRYDPNGYNQYGLQDFDFVIPVQSQVNFDSELLAFANRGKPGDSCSQRHSILHARSSVENGQLRTEIRLNRARWVCAIFQTRLGNDSGLIVQLHRPYLQEDGTIDFVSGPTQQSGFHWLVNLANDIGAKTKIFFSPTNALEAILSRDDLENVFETAFLEDGVFSATSAFNSFLLIFNDTEISERPEAISPQTVATEILKQCEGTIGSDKSILQTVIEDGEIKIQGRCILYEDV